MPTALEIEGKKLGKKIGSGAAAIGSGGAPSQSAAAAAKSTAATAGRTVAAASSPAAGGATTAAKSTATAGRSVAAASSPAAVGAAAAALNYIRANAAGDAAEQELRTKFKESLQAQAVTAAAVSTPASTALGKRKQNPTTTDDSAVTTEGGGNGAEGSNIDSHQSPNPSKRAKLLFFRCGNCKACRVKRCGKCYGCRYKMFVNKKSKKKCEVVMAKGNCNNKHSGDGWWKQIVVHAPPGRLGLILQFPDPEKKEELGLFDNVSDRPFVTGIAPKCPFRKSVKKGDQLLNIGGKAVQSAEDLPYKHLQVREVVFARKLQQQHQTGEKKPDSVKPSDVWATAEAAEMFGFAEGSDVKQLLRERVELLRSVNKTVDGYQLVAPKDGEVTKPYHKKEVMRARHRALLLCKAYLIALEKMDIVTVGINDWYENGKRVTRQECSTPMCTWRDCCDKAVSELKEIGIETVGKGGSLATLNKRFSESKLLLNPCGGVGGGGVDYTALLHHYPKIGEMVTVFVNDNKKKMSGKILQEEAEKNILPKVWAEAKENGDEGTKQFELLKKAVDKTPGVITMHKWVKHLGLKYDMYAMRSGKAWKDKHREASLRWFEDPENRKAHSAKCKDYYRKNPRKPKKAADDEQFAEAGPPKNEEGEEGLDRDEAANFEDYGSGYDIAGGYEDEEGGEDGEDYV